MQKEIIFIGLGKMGNAMAARLVESDFVVHGFDVDQSAREAAAKNGVCTYVSIAQMIQAMPNTKTVWLMLPAQFVDSALSDIYPHLQAADIIIDGGNSFYKDTVRRANDAHKKDIHYVDCGTSGGVKGARAGASLMVGGPTEVVRSLKPFFEALAVPNGFGHVGETGAGHFVKMVHNGIEYGMMGAIAEGLSFIEDQDHDLAIDPQEVLKAYRHGSIISGSLLDWLSEAYQMDTYLESIAGEVPVGKTESEMEYITSYQQSPILTAALKQRKDTRLKPSRTGVLISAMRNMFGGHKTIQK